MNKHILSELSRTREIMGLRYKNYNLLTEQAKYIDDLIKLFIRRGVSREVAEMMANRVERLFVKTQRRLYHTWCNYRKNYFKGLHSQTNYKLTNTRK